MLLIEKLKNHISKDEPHEKKSFWATDVEKDKFDIWHRWNGTPPTNPIDPEKKIMFSAAKMIEEAVVQNFKEMGLSVFEGEGQYRVDFERSNVRITGYIDSLIREEEGIVPVEIKTYYGDYQERELQKGIPKTSYLKQLAVYMDFLGVLKGYLLYFNRATGQMHQFTLFRNKNGLFKCFGIEFDINEEYERFNQIYSNYILTGLEPMPDYFYKYPIEKIDWRSISKSKISQARNNKSVIGDWQAKYSPYKEILVKKQGTCLGYSEEEIEQIKTLTKGYSTWK